MGSPGRIVAEIGKALGKAMVAGLGLELARLTTQQFRRRLGVDDDREEKRDRDRRDADPRDADPRDADRRDADRRDGDRRDGDDPRFEALRRENAALRSELDALRAALDEQRAAPKPPAP